MPPDATYIGVENASGDLVGASASNPVRIDPTGTTVQPVSGTITALQGTSPWVVSGTVTITPSGLQNVNVTQWDSVALGAPSAYGTSPGAVNVIGVNAFITNTPAVTVSGTVAVTQSTSPWIVAGGGTAGAPGTAVLTVQGISGGTAIPISGTVTATIATPTDWGTAPSTATLVPAVNAESFIGQTALAAVSNYGTAPSAVSAQGVNAFITNTVPVTLASTTITGTVAVTQSTSPWVVSLASTTITGTVAVDGALTNNNAAPTATLLGVLSAIAETAYNTVTYTTGDMVLPVTDLHGALNSDVQAVAGIQLGATGVVAYGSTPAAVNVPAVNAFITNTVPVTLASTTITGNVTVVQPTGTNLHVVVDSGSTITATVSGNKTNNNAAPGATNIGALVAQALTTPAAGYTTGNEVLLVTDLAGNTNTDLQAYNNNPVVGDGINGLIPVGNYGTTVTPDATWTSATGVNTAVTLVSNIEGYSSIAVSLNQTGTLTAGAVTFEISNDNTNWYPVEGVDPNTGVIVPSTYTLTIAFVIFLFTVPSPYFRVRLSTAIVGSGTLIIGHNVKTIPQVHNIAGTITGNFGTLTNNSAAPGVNNTGVLPALANAASPAWTEGSQVLESVDLTGRQRVRGTLTNNNAAPTADLLEVMPAVATTAAPTYTTGDAVMLSTDLSGNLRVTGGTTTGNLTNNNAAPAATNLGVLPAIAETAYTTVTYTTGNQVLPVTDLHGALNSDLQAVAGTAVVTAGVAGLLAVGGPTATGSAVSSNPVLVGGKDLSGNVQALAVDIIAGGGVGVLINSALFAPGDGFATTNGGGLIGGPSVGGATLALTVVPSVFNGTTWDRTRSAGIGNAVASTGIAASAAYGQYNSTAPAPTTGQYSSFQQDYAGNIFTKHCRRSQLVAKATTIASSAAATTIIAAPGAGIFADLSRLIISVAPLAAGTAPISFTATLSDGTNSFIYDMQADQLGTAVLISNPTQILDLNYDPSIPATTAATAWTLQLSVATVTVHITAVTILQKAS